MMCQDYFDIAQKCATVIIACCGLYFTRYIYLHTQEKSDVDKQKERNIQWLKALILDHSFKDFYIFFETTQEILNEFKVAGLADEKKSDINDQISDHFIALRRKFIDSLLAIDETLYNKVLDKTDNFQTHLANVIFDNGINLSHPPKFEEIVLAKFLALKTDIIRVIFQYTG